MSSNGKFPAAQLNWWRGSGRKRERLGSLWLREGDALVIGRDSSCKICLAHDEYCSQFHANVEARQHGIYIEDRNSTNGTWVNNERAQSAWLRHGDTVVIGDTVFALDAPALGRSTPAAPPRTVPPEMLGVGRDLQDIAHAIRQLDAQEDGRLRRLQSGALFKTLGDMIGFSPKTAERRCARLGRTLRLAHEAQLPTGSDLVQDLSNHLLGRSEDPPPTLPRASETSDWAARSAAERVIEAAS